MNSLENLDLTHSFSQLGADFYQSKHPDPVTDPYLVDFNPDAAELIGLSPAESQRQEFAEYFGGNKPLPGSQPLAMAYSGHQFGAYNPGLGDGRGLLLGEVASELKGTWDIYLKGCGPTRFSRGFDGRATLRASIREYLGGEALHGLGIPTTRSLAIIGIRDVVYREGPEAAGIVVRLSQSHIRFGSFQYFHFNNRSDNVTKIADYVIRRHFPEIQFENDKYRLLFRAVVERTARMVALWQSVGFIHGVMNTDNMAINGATFDYGPFGFMDRFNPEFTPNSSDGYGRYGFAQQPKTCHWNLFKMGETLTHLVEPKELQEELNSFQMFYDSFSRELMGHKLGLKVLDAEFNALVGGMFKLLYDNRADFTLFFRSLSDFPTSTPAGLKCSEQLDAWLSSYRWLIEREDPDMAERKKAMDRVNPRFILRSHFMQHAIDRALQEGDFSEIARLRILVSDPYTDRPEIFDQHGINPEHYASETPEPLVEMQLSCSA